MSKTVSDLFGHAPTVSVFDYKRRVPCVNPNLIIGLELETENCPRYGSKTLDPSVVEKLGIRVDNDNSLRGVAYEFITRPMQTACAIPVLEDFFKHTHFNDTNYTDRCSVHIHVNCLNLTPEQLVGLSLLYSIFEEVFFEFVGHDRDSNIYCIPWSHCRHNMEFARQFLMDPTNVARHWQKYTALNLLPLRTQGTVEFRHMHGTADMLKLSQWINMIGGMFQYIEKNSLDDIIKEVLELNTSSHYEKFFTQVLPQTLAYTNLYQQKLEDGVILAKYGLINYFNKKPKIGGATEAVVFHDDIVDPLQDIPPPPNIIRPAGRGIREALRPVREEATFETARNSIRQGNPITWSNVAGNWARANIEMTEEEMNRILDAAVHVTMPAAAIPPTERF